jgi:hypothetical protein
MGRLVVAIVLVRALVLPAARADSIDPVHHQIVVPAGRSVSVLLPGPAQTVCDDTTVVQVAYTRTAVYLIGVKPGRTLCGHYALSRARFFHVVFDVIVTPVVRHNWIRTTRGDQVTTTSPRGSGLAQAPWCELAIAIERGPRRTGWNSLSPAREGCGPGRRRN